MDLPKRKSPRIAGYDYATPNYYFITICTNDKKCIFGKTGNLSVIGKIAEENLLRIPELYSSITLDKYVIMPNHLHGIFVLSPNEAEKELPDLATVIGQYKMSVTKSARSIFPEINVWQRSFHDHIIRNQKQYEKIWLYIDGNPRKWEDDCFYCKEAEI